jgi:DnaJ-domain-containing protein 1
MDREILLRQLVQAEQDVAEGKAFIAKQHRLIVESERDDCHDVAEAMRLLEAYLVLQRSREEDRARILDELSE